MRLILGILRYFEQSIILPIDPVFALYCRVMFLLWYQLLCCQASMSKWMNDHLLYTYVYMISWYFTVWCYNMYDMYIFPMLHSLWGLGFAHFFFIFHFLYPLQAAFVRRRVFRHCFHVCFYLYICSLRTAAKIKCSANHCIFKPMTNTFTSYTISMNVKTSSAHYFKTFLVWYLLNGNPYITVTS